MPYFLKRSHRLLLPVLSICIGFLALMFGTSGYVFGAEIYLESSQGNYHFGDTFLVDIRVDNEGECVNAVDVTIEYDASALTAVDFGRGQSFITLWIEEPVLDNEAGTVSFSGGLPGGYCGRISGDPGPSNLLGKVVFTTEKSAVEGFEIPDVLTEIVVRPSSEVLLNDGFGTPAEIKTRDASLILTSSTEAPINEWNEEVRGDNVAPELFEIELHQDESVAGGRYFVIFSTTDKQSGVNRYEIFETDPKNFGFSKRTGKPTYWLPVESPYVLQDQKLTSLIMVKAVDEAGNERIVELLPDKPFLESLAETPAFSTVVVLLLASIVAFYFRENEEDVLRKVKEAFTRKKNENEDLSEEDPSPEDEKEENADEDIEEEDLKNQEDQNME